MGGPGSCARFVIPISTASDGQGGLYVVDHKRVWKLQLPESWRAVGSNGREPTRTSSNKGGASNTGRVAAAGAACIGGGGGGGGCDRDAAAAAAGGVCSSSTHLPRSAEGQAVMPESTAQGQVLEQGQGQGVQQEEVQVRPLDCGPVLSSEATAVAYDPSTRTLLLSTDTAIYRRSLAEGPPLCVTSSCSAATSTASPLPPQQQQQQQQPTGPWAIAQPDAPPIGAPGPPAAAAAAAEAAAAAAAGASGGAPAQTIHPILHTANSTTQATLELLAGRQDVSGHADGRGPHARFRGILGLVVDGCGCAYVTDYNEAANSTAVRWVAPDGTVVTLVSHLEGIWGYPAILPNGYLALCSRGGSQLMVLDLGLTPNACDAAAAATAAASSPAPHTLASDLGELLDRQPDGTANVTVEVGGQAFAAHRGVLAARSPYFRQRLDPGAGFADGGAQRLSLPDADPAAFGVVLRYMYTDSVGAIAEGLLQHVGELADRLLLPGLCEEVGTQLLAGVSEDNVVSLLLWADQRSGSFGALLAGLKEWFVVRKDAVAGRDLTSIRRLMVESPDLAVELYHSPRQEHLAGHKRPRVG